MKKYLIHKISFLYLLIFALALAMFSINIEVKADNNVEYCDESCFNVSSKTEIREELFPPKVFYTSTYEGTGGKNIEFLEVANKLFSSKFAVEDTDISNKEVYLNGEKLVENTDFIYRVEEIDGGIKISYTFTESGLSKVTDNWVIQVKGIYKPKMGETTFIGCHKIYGIKEKETQEVELEVPSIDKNVDCDNDYKLIVPAESESVKYLETTIGKTVVVKAIAKDGYTFRPGTITEWIFDITNNEKCPINGVTPLSPKLSEVPCGEKPELILPEQEGVKYSYIEKDNKYIVEASPEEGYYFSGRLAINWVLDINIDNCVVKVIPKTPVVDEVGCDEKSEVLLPKQEGVAYQIKEINGKYLVDAIPEEGCVFEDNVVTHWEFNANIEKCLVTNPERAQELPKTGNNDFVIVGGLMVLASSLITLSFKRKVN